MNIEPINMPEIGLLEARFLDSGELLCFECPVTFRNSEPDLVIYPSNDKPPSQKEIQKLTQRFDQFLARVGDALESFPDMLRSECDNYNLQVEHLSDTQLVNGLEWQNIKLDPSGCVACYAKNAAVTTNFDISMEFSKKCRLVSLHFDG